MPIGNCYLFPQWVQHPWFSSFVCLPCGVSAENLNLAGEQLLCTTHSSFDFCQIFCERNKEASIIVVYPHISLSFVCLFVCVHTCTRVHTFVFYLFVCVRTCTHVPTFAMLHIWRSTGQLLELVFSFYSGLQESNSGHQAKAGASKSQRTTCGSQGSHSEHQVGSKLPYLLSNLTTRPWVNISWRLDVALWYKHEPNQVSSSRGHGSRYAQGLDETERDMHSLYCLELGMLGKDYSSRRAASSIWVCVSFSLVLLRWAFT